MPLAAGVGAGDGTGSAAGAGGAAGAAGRAVACESGRSATGSAQAGVAQRRRGGTHGRALALARLERGLLVAQLLHLGLDRGLLLAVELEHLEQVWGSKAEVSSRRQRSTIGGHAQAAAKRSSRWDAPLAAASKSRCSRRATARRNHALELAPSSSMLRVQSRSASAYLEEVDRGSGEAGRQPAGLERRSSGASSTGSWRQRNDALEQVQVGLGAVERVDGRLGVEQVRLRVAACRPCRQRWRESARRCRRALEQGRAGGRTDGLGPLLALEVLVAGVLDSLCAVGGRLGRRRGLGHGRRELCDGGHGGKERASWSTSGGQARFVVAASSSARERAGAAGGGAADRPPSPASQVARILVRGEREILRLSRCPSARSWPAGGVAEARAVAGCWRCWSDLAAAAAPPTWQLQPSPARPQTTIALSPSLSPSTAALPGPLSPSPTPHTATPRTTRDEAHVPLA